VNSIVLFIPFKIIPFALFFFVQNNFFALFFLTCMAQKIIHVSYNVKTMIVRVKNIPKRYKRLNI